MLRRHNARRVPRFEDEEDERVVYNDLDNDTHTRNLLLSPAQPRASTRTEPDGPQIFPRQQQSLFNLDDSGDEAEKEEEENPFATLLQQQEKAPKSIAVEVEEPSGPGAAGTRHETSFLSVAAVEAEISLRGGTRRSILKRSQPQKTSVIPRVGVNTKKKLGFESAGSRPDRWSTKKPTAVDTNNRRKSLSAIQKRRSQLEASAAAKRRKSMPPQSRSSMGDSIDGGSAASKTRLLSDVLQRATQLSQQQNSTNDEASFSQPQDENPTDGDAILDTEHQMRAEPFAPQIFSPSKPVAPGTSAGRKLRPDSIVSKIRGSVGDVIRKAIRKSNRDLTLLRSHGQHLLPQQNGDSSAMGTIGAVESIQDRAHVVVCLKRYCGETPHFAVYECATHEIAAKLEKVPAELQHKVSVVLEAHFNPHTAKYLKLSPGKLVKIYEPLHFVADHAAAGSTKKQRWLLLSTQLAEVVEDSHHCTDPHE